MTDEEKLRRMQATYAKLPSRHRDIFAAIRIDGWTYIQVANRTGYSVRRVERIMAKVIAALDRSLND